MNDEDHLNERRNALKESVKFFASDRKVEREKWVVSKFLENLGLVFSNTKIIPVADDPPDIRFRTAELEVKEIMDHGRRRHLEYKEVLDKACAAIDPTDLWEFYEPRDATLIEIYKKILKVSSGLLDKYAPGVCRNLDLLFYVNLKDVMELIETPFPDTSVLRSQPWRSVSFVMGDRACVLFARDDAPTFLKRAIGKVLSHSQQRLTRRHSGPA